ncbi:MAG TPA: DUF202 domain-containing protein [Micromonosporaceae bacterium]|nr:DUF202 domain-containing protein [Micromonosporaceae bacterium]
MSGGSDPGALGGGALGRRRDAGLQAERTRLAWRRTCLAVTVIALLTARLAVLPAATPARLLALVGAFALWLAVVGLSRRRVLAMPPSGPGAAGRLLAVLALAVTGYAVLGVLLTAFGAA